MSEYDDELDYSWWSTTQRPSKAAERESWKKQAQEELDELADLYGVETNILRGISYIKHTYGTE